MLRFVITTSDPAGNYNIRCPRRSCKRVSVHRQNQLVSTRWGPVQIKVGSLGEYPINVQAEYEDCAELARLRFEKFL